MSRIKGIEAAEASGYVGKILQAQKETWGGPLLNHLVYAKRPALFKAVRGMWAGLDKDGHLGEPLISLINRRVAILNGCEF